ncbi:MAG: S1C family serine protease [Clostridium sp.]|nr:S1C family serine protease [Clostridium sp.]
MQEKDQRADEKLEEALGKEEDSFQFVKEKIKERPINKKKLLRRTIITAVMALVFGLVACVTFFALEPIISNWLYPEKEPEVVTFPEEQEETMPEDMAQTDNDLPGAETEEEPEPAPPQKVTVYEKVELTAQDYAKLYTELAAVAQKMQESMVIVSGVTADTDWFNDVYEDEAQSSGLIVADNGIDLLILATESKIRDYQQVMITFHDGTVAEAVRKQTDPNTGLCILAVKLANMSAETRASAKPAVLGSSNSLTLLGSPIIAVGSPTGSAGSVCYGMITSNSSSVKLVDVNYRLLTTDIYGNAGATGVLINFSGQVVGIIDNTYNASDMRNQISAIGITELKQTIEAMSNEKERASIGIHGVDITAALSESLQMPRGVCVQSFEMGSPAMICGIQGNDIITGIGVSVINSMGDLTRALYQYAPGDVVTVTLQRKAQETYRTMEVEVTLGVLE